MCHVEIGRCTMDGRNTGQSVGHLRQLLDRKYVSLRSEDQLYLRRDTHQEFFRRNHIALSGPPHDAFDQPQQIGLSLVGQRSQRAQPLNPLRGAGRATLKEGRLKLVVGVRRWGGLAATVPSPHPTLPPTLPVAVIKHCFLCGNPMQAKLSFTV